VGDGRGRSPGRAEGAEREEEGEEVEAGAPAVMWPCHRGAVRRWCTIRFWMADPHARALRHRSPRCRCRWRSALPLALALPQLKGLPLLEGQSPGEGCGACLSSSSPGSRWLGTCWRGRCPAAATRVLLLGLLRLLLTPTWSLLLLFLLLLLLFLLLLPILLYLSLATLVLLLRRLLLLLLPLPT